MSNSLFGTQIAKLLIDLEKNSQILPPRLIRKLNSSNWLNEAKMLIKNLSDDLDLFLKTGKSQEKSLDLIVRTQYSIIQVRELNTILKCFNLVNAENKDGYIDKLVKSLNMPLLPEEEDSDRGTQQGRDFLFELKILTKFISSGYRCTVEGQHPDLSIYINNQKYAVECKRLYIESSFEKNIVIAIKQLEKKSFVKDNNTLGIVALNFSRFFDQSERVRLINLTDANRRLAEDYQIFQKKTFDIFEKINVPLKIKYFMFEFDRYIVLGNTVQNITFMDIFDPKLVKDFKKIRNYYNSSPDDEHIHGTDATSR